MHSNIATFFERQHNYLLIFIDGKGFGATFFSKSNAVSVCTALVPDVHMWKCLEFTILVSEPLHL